MIIFFSVLWISYKVDIEKWKRNTFVSLGGIKAIYKFRLSLWKSQMRRGDTVSSTTVSKPAWHLPHRGHMGNFRFLHQRHQNNKWGNIFILSSCWTRSACVSVRKRVFVEVLAPVVKSAARGFVLWIFNKFLASNYSCKSLANVEEFW